MTEVFSAVAPTNIALVKYMGKLDPDVNLPANESVSLTLSSLCTFTECSLKEGEKFEVNWIAEAPLSQTGMVPDLDTVGVNKIIQHIKRVLSSLEEYLNIKILNQKKIEVRSCNTFPQATGIASSAAAFAALTMAVIKLGLFLTKQDQENKLLLDKEFQRFIVKLSRCGSGSSCRSFYGPWVRWGKDSVEPIVSKMPEMVDLVLLVNSAPKKVSSTRAHELVKTSQLWDGRVKRANDRVQKIVQAIQTGDTDTVSQIAWQEMWEMHSLFHTCERPFTYWDGRTIEILKWLECYVNGEKKGSTTLPIVTSDAGANIHVLVPKTEAGAWLELIKNKFSDTVLQDVQGRGVFGF